MHSTSLDFSFAKSSAIIDKVGRKIGENLMVVLTKHGIVRDPVLG